MSYRRFNNPRRRYKERPIQHERSHAHSDTFYSRDVDRIGQSLGNVGKELNINSDDYSDGLNMRWKVTEPTVTVKNYTHDVPQDKRTVCATCKHGGTVQDLHNGKYRCWCREAFARGAFAWKEIPYTLQDMGCRDWLPKSQDCIG